MERIEKIKEMLAANPSDSFLLHALGLEYIKIGELNLSKQSFEQVLVSNVNYIGTYYHLAKVNELLNEIKEAILIYEKGIIVANQLKDNHAKNELQMALDDLMD